MARNAAIALLGVATAFGPPLAFAQQQPPGGGPDWGVRLVVTLPYPK